jgi:hypothetical protein
VRRRQLRIGAERFTQVKPRGVAILVGGAE